MSDSGEKILPPSPRKLRDARQKGQVARGKDLVTAAVTAVSLITLSIMGPPALAKMADVLTGLDALERQPLDTAVSLLVHDLAWVALGVLGPLYLLLGSAAVLATIVATGGLTLSAHPIVPQFDRINPVSGFGRLFSLRSLIELLKSLTKLAVVLVVVGMALRSHVAALAAIPLCGLGCLPRLAAATLTPLWITCCVVFLLLGLLDVGLQRWLLQRDLRMTHTEHKRDRKDTEGDPHLLSLRRKERRDTAKFGSRTGLKHASFVIASPTVTLAFRYAQPDASVPVLVARAGNEAAATLASEARRKGLPVVFDPDAADALRSKVEIGRMVPKSAFIPVIRCMKEAGLIG